jgi:hypothetical protein
LQKARASSVELYADNGVDGAANKAAALALWDVIEAPLQKAFPDSDIECDAGFDRGKRMSRISVTPKNMDDCGYASPPENRQRMAVWLAAASGKFYDTVKPAVISYSRKA